MRVDARVYIKAKRAGRATSVRVAPTGTAVEQYQVPLGNRHSLKEAGVIGLPSWSEKATQNETWVRVPRLSALCPRRVVTFDGGRGNIDRTFEFGDDFDGTALNPVKWAAVGGGYTVAAGVITITDAVGTQRTLTSSATFGTNTAVRVRKSANVGAAGASSACYVQVGYSNGTIYAVSDVYSDSSTTGKFDKLYTYQSAVTLSPDVGYSSGFYTYDIIRNGTASVIYKRDGAVAATNTDNIPTGNLPIYSLTYKAATVTTAVSIIDWLLVRKRVPAEPLAGTAAPSTTNRALCRPLSHADLMRAVCA